jgi:hypothetical protein
MKKDLFWAIAMLALVLIIVWLISKEAEAAPPHQPAAPSASPQGEAFTEERIATAPAVPRNDRGDEGLLEIERPRPKNWTVPEEDNTACLVPEWQDYVLRVITAEGGTDFGVCAGVTQCLFNACEKDGWVHTPKEMMIRYRWTSPVSFISEEAERAFDEIFCSGVTYTAFGNATVFYAPAYCNSAYHESQRFVCEVGGVRFFEEVG